MNTLWSCVISVVVIILLLYIVGRVGKETLVAELRGSPQVVWSGFRDIIYELRPVVTDAGPSPVAGLVNQ